VQFAGALHTLIDRSTPNLGTPEPRNLGTSNPRNPGTSIPRWFLAAAAVILMVASAYLAVRDRELRRELSRVDSDLSRLQQQNQQLERQLAETRRPNEREPAAPVTATFLLLPPTRGVGDVPTVSLGRDIEQVTFRLQVQIEELPAYRIDLKDLAANRTLWRSGDLPLESAPDGARIVSATVPRSLLAGQRYALELFAVPRAGSGELLGSYVVRVVPQ
jgi:hypothetical protein